MTCINSLFHASLARGCTSRILRCIVSGAILFSSGIGIAQQYTATDIGIVSAVAINNVGQIAGSYITSSSYSHAFLYANGQLQDLGVPADAGPEASLSATGLNDSGQVVGVWASPSSSSGSQPFLYSQGQMEDLTAAVGVTPLEGVDGISDSSQILLNGHYLYSVNTGTTTDIAASAPAGFSTSGGYINSAGQVDGEGLIVTASGSTYAAYSYSNGSFSVVSPYSIPCPVVLADEQEGGSYLNVGPYNVTGIGPQGQVLGWTILNPAVYAIGPWEEGVGYQWFCLPDAMVFANGQTTDLGEAPLAYENYSYYQTPTISPVAMNASGTIVGSYSANFVGTGSPRAFISENGALTDLSSDLVGSLAGTVVLQAALGINECGEIIAQGFYSADTTETNHSFVLTPASGGSGGCGSITLIDPLPSNVNGSGVLPNAAALSIDSNSVGGVAADGAAEIVVRIPAAAAGTQFQVSLEDENGQQAAAGSADALGYLTTLLPSDGSGSTANGTPITLTTVSVGSGGSMAFAVYHPPIDFVRDGNSTDPSLANRRVMVTATSSSVQLTQAIQIVRPPVVFVHGLFGHPSDGSQIAAGLQAAGLGFAISDLGYDSKVQVTSSSPSYGTNYSVSGATLGFKYAASQILPQLEKVIALYRTNNPLSQQIAVVSADVVAHSMGGDATRYLPLISGYSSSQSYGVGPVHKLITIGTPHLGSPVATQLVNSSSACTRGILSRVHLYAFTSATTSAGTFPGGVGDLEGDLAGDSSSLSSALKAVQTGTTTLKVTIPTGIIVGSMTSAQLATVDSSPSALLIRAFCSSKDPLAQDLTSANWPTLVGQGSDAIVPLNSEEAGSSSNATLLPLQAVHSPGAESLGFADGTNPGPAETDASSGVVSEVLQLLNTPVTNSAYRPLP